MLFIPPHLSLSCVAMRHSSDLRGVIGIVVFYFFLRILHSERSQLGMISGCGGRHGTACQSPSLPRLTEEVKPTLLIDHLQVEFLTAVIFGIHPHGIVHHVGSHIVAPSPDIKVSDIAGVLRIEKDPTTGLLWDMGPEQERLIDT